MKTTESKNSLPLVSIVTPSFNQAQFIEQAIQCVLSQDYPNIEHIVVDGASTDETVAILRKYDDKIHWISEPDNGQSEALNKGFQLAEGDIIGWLNADDLYMPYTVSLAVDYLQKYPEVSLVHGAGQYIDENGRVIMSRRGGDFGLEKLIGINTIMSIATFFRREIFDSVGFLNEDLHYVMDWEYWIRIAMAGLKLKHIPDPVMALSREHSNAKTIQVKERFWQERFKVFETLFNSPDLPKDIKRLEKRAYSGVYASSAYFYLRYGQFGKSFSALQKSLKLYPSILFVYNPLFVIQNLIEIIRANIYLNNIRK